MINTPRSARDASEGRADQFEGTQAEPSAGSVGIQTAEARSDESRVLPAREPAGRSGGIPGAYRAVFACVCERFDTLTPKVRKAKRGIGIIAGLSRLKDRPPNP